MNPVPVGFNGSVTLKVTNFSSKLMRTTFVTTSIFMDSGNESHISSKYRDEIITLALTVF